MFSCNCQANFQVLKCCIKGVLSTGFGANKIDYAKGVIKGVEVEVMNWKPDQLFANCQQASKKVKRKPNQPPWLCMREKSRGL